MSGKTAEAFIDLEEELSTIMDATNLIRRAYEIQLATADIYKKIEARRVLYVRWPDKNTRNLIAERAVQDKDSDFRSILLRFLIDKWPGKYTKNFLKQFSIEASLTRNQRGELCVALGKMHSWFGTIVFMRDYDGKRPYLDPRKPISSNRIKKAASIASVPAEKIDETVRSLSEHLGWDILKGATG